MTSVSVTEFRRCLPEYLDRVVTGEEVHITRRGRVIARLTLPEDSRNTARKKLEALRAVARIGDVEAPIDVTWEAGS